MTITGGYGVGGKKREGEGREVGKLELERRKNACCLVKRQERRSFKVCDRRIGSGKAETWELRNVQMS